MVQVGVVICHHKQRPEFSQRFLSERVWAGGTFEGDGGGAGSALADRGLDGVGGVVAGAGRSGNGPPLGDNGRLAEGDDGVLVLQAAVVIQRGQPSLPVAAAVTVQLLREETGGKRAPASFDPPGPHRVLGAGGSRLGVERFGVKRPEAGPDGATRPRGVVRQVVLAAEAARRTLASAALRRL